jgi:hypothetical protein
MNALEAVEIQCPYCGESIGIVVDASIGNRRQIESCSICCRPIDLDISIDAENGIDVTATRDDA